MHSLGSPSRDPSRQWKKNILVFCRMCLTKDVRLNDSRDKLGVANDLAPDRVCHHRVSAPIVGRRQPVGATAEHTLFSRRVDCAGPDCRTVVFEVVGCHFVDIRKLAICERAPVAFPEAINQVDGQCDAVLTRQDGIRSRS